MAVKPVSCGVIVSDGARILLGHATRTPRWDIPKGIADPGEPYREAALRELREETGLAPPPGALLDLGVHPYLPGKDLALFLWRHPGMPDPATLQCTTMVTPPRGAPFPELDRFGVFAWAEAMTLVGRNLARILGSLDPTSPQQPTPEA